MEPTVRFLRTHPDALIPEYKTAGAIAFDIGIIEDKEIQPGEMAFIRTGLVVCTPTGYGLILANRSSNAKKEITLSNGIGVIDQDYCGPEDELHLSVRNLGKGTYHAKKGERLAQGLFIPILKGVFEEAEKLTAPNRGGYGTTG